MKKGILTLPIDFKISLFLVLLFVFQIKYNAQVVINEIMVNPSGTNDGSNMPNTAEWIELYNMSASPVVIGCWVITDGDFSVTIPAGATIPAFGYFTIASAVGTGLAPSLNWATCGCTAGGSTTQVGIFTNSGEQLLLYNGSGTIQDALIWGGGQLPGSFTSASVGSCGSQSFTFPSAGSGLYEDIGSSSTDGASRERSYDGSATWQSGGSGTFATSNGPIPLPIELISFSVKNNSDVVDITWATATETDNDYFVIERSRDGYSFDQLLVINASGNSLTENVYEAKDKTTVKGLSYYRLKQVDKNGTYSYSSIESVLVENSETRIEIDLFPNPTSDGNFKIKIGSGVSSDALFEIMDSAGNLVFQSYLQDGQSAINLSEFDNGVYLIQVKNGGSFLSKKVLVIK